MAKNLPPALVAIYFRVAIRQVKITMAKDLPPAFAGCGM